MRTPNKINITIDTRNAAFDDCEHGEVARILRHAAKRFAEQPLNRLDDGILADTNGDTVGFVTIEPIK